uniref:Uncharacterized protein n=1 Tax=Fagus sylvatica TaxID=28930 RepID=A0A2N9GDH8_FAGSY
MTGRTPICPSQSPPAVLMIRFHVTPRVLRFDMMSLECCAPYKMTSQLYLNRRTSIEVMMVLFNAASSPTRFPPLAYKYPILHFLASACLSPVQIFEHLASSAFGPPNNSLFPVLSPIMGKKRTEEDRGKLARYVNTPENMALFRRLYRVPDDVGLRYVHWSDALPPSSGELLIPVVAVVEGGVRFPIDSWPTSSTILACPPPKDINYTLVNGLPDTNRGFDDDYLVVSGEWFLPGRKCPTKDGVPDSKRRKPRKNLVKLNSLRQVWECEHCTDDWAQPRSAAKLLRYTAQTHSYLACRLVPDLEATKANPENDALPAIDIRDVIDGTAPDMAGINLRNLLPTRREEGTSGDAPSSSRQALRKRGRTESTAGPSRATADPLPSPAIPEGPGTDQLVTQLGNVIRPVTEEDSILPVGDERSSSVASALSQAVRLPLDMGEWKKATDDELINNVRRGVLMGVQASLELEERFRTNKEHLAHANVLALKYQDAKKMAADAKKLTEEADAKRLEAEDSLIAALDSLTKAEDRIRALESEFDQAKKATYEAGSSDAQAEMGEQLPGVCNEFYLDGWKKSVSALSSGQTTLPPLPPSVPYPGARPPPPPEVVLATPLEVPVTPMTELSTDIVNLEDEENSAEAAVPEDADQAPGAPDGGSVVPDEAGPDT